VLVYLHQTGPRVRNFTLRTIRPLTNDPRKIVGLDAYGIQITEQVPV
jgi:GTP cyclohydrolase II